MRTGAGEAREEGETMAGVRRNQLKDERAPRTLGGRGAVVVAAVLAAVLLLALPAGASAIVPEGQIKGKVIAFSGKAPIKGLYVCANATVGNSGGCASTDAGGEYTINVPEGKYTVEFYGENCESGCYYLNYLSQFWEDVSPNEEPTLVHVEAGTPTTEIDAEMRAGGILGGQVTDTKAFEIEGEEVCAYSEEDEYVYRCVHTALEGFYRIEGLPTQNYTIEFYPFGNYVGQYFENQPTEQMASPVKVVAGGETSGKSAKLSEGAKIKGVVTAAAGGAPIQGIRVCPRTVGTAAYAECANTGPKGEYTLEALEGEYGVSFEGNSSFGPELYENATSEASEKHIKTTPGKTVEGINGSLPTSGQITGTVTAAPSGAAVSGIEVCARDEIEFQSCGYTTSTGEYTIRGVVGRYRVEFYGYETCNKGCTPLPYTYQYFNGVPSYERAQVLAVAPGATVSGVNARLAKTVKQLEEETENRKIAEAIAKKHAEEVAQQEAAAKAAAAKAAAVKHAEEVAAEAARRKALEEHEHAEAAALASFKILRVSTTGTTLFLTLKLLATENLTLGGPAFKRTVVHGKAGKHVFRIPLSPTGRAARRRHRKATLTLSINEGAFTIVLSEQLKF